MHRSRKGAAELVKDQNKRGEETSVHQPWQASTTTDCHWNSVNWGKQQSSQVSGELLPDRHTEEGYLCSQWAGLWPSCCLFILLFSLVVFCSYCCVLSLACVRLPSIHVPSFLWLVSLVMCWSPQCVCLPVSHVGFLCLLSFFCLVFCNYQ